MVEAVIVADGGERGGVGGERDRRQRIAVEHEAGQEFGGDMLGVGGAAAIAGQHQLAAVAKRLRDPLGNGRDRGQQVAVAGCLRQGGLRGFEMRGDVIGAHKVVVAGT